MIMEGVCEIVLAFFFAESIAVIFNVFPASIIGAMLLFASLELGKFITAMRRIELAQVIIIGIISFFTNLAAGFLIGIIIVYFFRKKGLI